MRLGVLIANKTDLQQRRVVTESQGSEFAAAKELKYFECSAVSSDIIILSWLQLDGSRGSL